jgi:hypothetical protein
MTSICGDSTSKQNRFYYFTYDRWDRVVDWLKERQPLLRFDGTPYHGKWTTPVKVAVKRRQMGDIVWSEECLIQDHVLQIFRSEGLTGFDVDPADVRVLFPHKPKPVFWELKVLGWGGIAPEESGIRRIDDPFGSGKSTYTPFSDAEKLVDLGQWDGSDFFIVWPLPRFYLVTSRVVEVVQRHELKHCRFVPLQEWSQDEPNVLLGPGRLSDWFPDERARQIGEPLGIY